MQVQIPSTVTFYIACFMIIKLRIWNFLCCLRFTKIIQLLYLKICKTVSSIYNDYYSIMKLGSIQLLIVWISLILSDNFTDKTQWFYFYLLWKPSFWGGKLQGSEMLSNTVRKPLYSFHSFSLGCFSAQSVNMLEWKSMINNKCYNITSLLTKGDDLACHQIGSYNSYCYSMHRLAQNGKLLVRSLMTWTEWWWFEPWKCGILTVMDCLSLDIKPKEHEDTEMGARIRIQGASPHPDFFVMQASMWQWEM